MRTETITHHQFTYLQGFFTHVWCVTHEKAKSDYAFWAKQLDDLGISWYVQNLVAALADKRINGFYYLRSLLNDRGITIQY